MLKIRLTRTGKKNRAQFRVVVAQHTAPVKGRFVEILGSLDPHNDIVNLKAERIKYWLGQGAQSTPRIHNLLIDHKIIEGEKVTTWKPKRKEQTEEEVKAVKSENAEEPVKTDK